MIRKLIDRVFRMEEIATPGCPVYLRRWRIFSNKKVGGIYLHHILSDDNHRDPHDHPWRCISIGLWGEYWEETYAPIRCSPEHPVVIDAVHHYSAPWIRRFQPEHIHRLRVHPKSYSEWEGCRFGAVGAWTLCFISKPKREWGFWYGLKKWIPWREYAYGEAGVERRDC